MPYDPIEEYRYKERLELGGIEPDLPTAQKIHCPSCLNSVPADNLNIQNNMAKCSSCDMIFSFSKEVEQLSNVNNISQEILQPEGVELNHFRDELDISVQQDWSPIEIIGVSLFPMAIVVSMSVFIEFFPSNTTNGLILFAFLITSVIGYIAYFFLRKRHKVYIRIDEQNLHIERRPKKLMRDRKYNVEDIDQVYIKNMSNSSGNKGAGVFMIVNDVMGQKHVKLIQLVSSRSKAKYIEQEIEKYLGIKNRKVPEEDS